MLGFQAGDLDKDATHVWADNWQALVVFDQMATQWRMGSHSAIGLDYNVIPHIFRMSGIKRKDQPALFADLRVMENEALNIINAKE